MSDIGTAHDVATLLLESSAEALDTVHAFDATLEGAQGRQFTSPGQPVMDCCGQLAVYIPVIAPGDTSPGGLDAGKRFLHGQINIVNYQIVSSRCIPNGFDPQTGIYNPPIAASLSAAARQLDCDGWALFNHLFHLQASGLLRNLCDEVFFDGLNALPPSGGCAGWIAQVRVQVDGYAETLST